MLSGSTVEPSGSTAGRSVVLPAVLPATTDESPECFWNREFASGTPLRHYQRAGSTGGHYRQVPVGICFGTGSGRQRAVVLSGSAGHYRPGP